MPDGFAEIKDAVTDRVRMLKALMLPIGGHPATGTVYSHYHPALYNDLKALESYKEEYLKKAYPEFGRFPDEKFGFTSVAFPYSGYYVLRDGWKADSVYLWLIGARMGMGHASFNINGVALCAYGMNMLINAGASCYDNMTFVLPEQRGIIKQIEKYKRSSYGENTLLIDGKSQSRLDKGENNFIEPYQTAIDAGFHTGEQFDFAEGFYDGPYGELNAVHNRQVIFVKKLKIFIIIDRVDIEGKHKFTECWHVMPDDIKAREQYGEGWKACGYKPEEIFTEGNKVYTAKPDAPNFSIHVFGSNPEITRHYGELEPCSGWLSPCIVGERYKKTDIHVEWEADGPTKLVTVISPYRNKEEVISRIECSEGLHIYAADGEEVLLTEDEIRIGENVLKFSEITAPEDFFWKKENGLLKPDYTRESTTF